MMIGSILLASSGLGSLSLLKQIHGYTVRHGLLDLVLENTIIDIYGECGEVGYASLIFERIKDKDVVTWTSMITCYVQNGFLNEALNLFLDMVKANIEPDAVAIVGILDAIAGLSSLLKGKEIHGSVMRRGLSMDGLVCSSLVDMYARCGDIDNSLKIFNRLRSKDLVLWTSMINVSGMHGRGKESIDLFNKMSDIGLVPDHVAFLAILYACAHSGLTSEGKNFLERMINDFGLEPWSEHYACVVDLLGRSGKMDEAFEFIKDMPIEPTAAVWCSLLGACRVHSNRKLGEVAAEKLLELEPENPGNYVLVSNFYASMGEWKEVDDVRGRMKRRGLRKDPACSWIDVGNKVHTFVAMDNSHEHSVEIYSKLSEITERLEMEGGYVADTRFVLHDVSEEQKVKMLQGHSERLAIAFGLIRSPEDAPIRITKNLRVCGDCHEFTKLVSKVFEREIVVRDANRFHHFRDGYCSCREFW
ncbi:pentatricopeptide repeat-containing protein, chloroplastic [Iris pallida]|nr:pentatricopeptide repeat-containing protein, chloroplastic [Iris pallida]